MRDSIRAGDTVAIEAERRAAIGQAGTDVCLGLIRCLGDLETVSQLSFRGEAEESLLECGCTHEIPRYARDDRWGPLRIVTAPLRSKEVRPWLEASHRRRAPATPCPQLCRYNISTLCNLTSEDCHERRKHQPRCAAAYSRLESSHHAGKRPLPRRALLYCRPRRRGASRVGARPRRQRFGALAAIWHSHGGEF